MFDLDAWDGGATHLGMWILAFVACKAASLNFIPFLVSSPCLSFQQIVLNPVPPPQVYCCYAEAYAGPKCLSMPVLRLLKTCACE
jgi:hypothetical protein